MDVVRHTLSPELLNRIDETVIFNRLQRESMDAIADIQLNEIRNRLEEGHSMKMDISASAKSVLAEMGYDVRYGARPLKRTLNKMLLNPLSHLLLEESLREGDTVFVRTRFEAEMKQQSAGTSLGWISGNPLSEDKNDVVILRNHKVKSDDGKEEEERKILLEDGLHGIP